MVSEKTYEKLNPSPIRVGVIGTGAMGAGIINQITRYTSDIKVIAAFNRDTQKAILAFKTAGIDVFKVANNLKETNESIDAGLPIITNDIELLLQAKNIDLLIEVTGTIEFAAKTIIRAFNEGKSVLSFNVEIDATFGPLLKAKAKQNNVLYGVADGDQPGVTMNLYRFVTDMGFTPLLCGNIKGLEDHYRNPTTQECFAKTWGISPHMATSFADGTKISFEQACIANATNMRVARRGMLAYRSTNHIDELTHLYDIDQLKALGGIVDYVVGAKPSPGIFIYASTDDPLSTRYLNYCKLGKGPLYSFYIPYHLLFFEIANSIRALVNKGQLIVSPLAGPVVEVFAAAKVNMSQGCLIDGMGGYKTYGVSENSDIAAREKLLPMGLAEGARVIKEIKTDQLLTFDDVEIDPDSYTLKLYKEQCAIFSI